MVYIVAGTNPWNKQTFNEVICHYPGEWHFFDQSTQFSEENIKRLNPRYIFFLHWSWYVPEVILNNYECVCFHMTDVPYGRGGSPLQNLIVRGHRETMLTALKMAEEFDAGPVYLKQSLSLEGNAEEIYIRATSLSAQMILDIITEQPTPTPQVGKPTIFKRRKPEQSEVGQADSLLQLYDFIRMLDAEGYPKAFIEYAGYRYEFSRAAFYNGRIEADVTIMPLIKD